MKAQYHKMKNLFLRQSCMDSWEDYNRSLNKENFIRWDYLILTASNESQAEIYREQIQYRLDHRLIPAQIHYAVLPDPEGKRVGSGGPTFHALRYVAEQEGRENPFAGKRIMVIHSGGDSKRVPQYSACGKLFSPVPRELPNGEASTLFDEFVIGMTGVPARIKEGMLVLSGDVLLLFNPLQIDSQFHGAAAISMKEHVETGKEHGVFLNDGTDYVARFLHKQTEERLRQLGAVNDQDKVDLDTGAILMDCDLLNSLYGLISTQGKVDQEKYDSFVNEKARVSFYGDFLFPLAKEATLEQYYQEAAEGQLCPELMECRRKIWDAIHIYNMKLLRLSPAEFIHFGTTRELLTMLTESIDAYEFLDWKRLVGTNLKEEGAFAVPGGSAQRQADVAVQNNAAQKQADAAVQNNTAQRQADVGVLDNTAQRQADAGVLDNTAQRQADAAVLDNTAQKQVTFAVHNSFVQKQARLGESCYIEDSYVGRHAAIGRHSILAGVSLEEGSVPDETVFHGLKLQDGTYVVRVYGVGDNPKGTRAGNTSFLGTTLQEFMKKNHLSEEELWGSADGSGKVQCFRGQKVIEEEVCLQGQEGAAEEYLWDARLYGAGATWEEALDHAWILCRMAQGTAGEGDILVWKQARRLSLCGSFNQADIKAGLSQQKELENRILAERFLESIRAGEYYREAKKVFGTSGMNLSQYRLLMEAAGKSSFSEKIRIYYDVSRIMKEGHLHFEGKAYDTLETKCFQTIQEEIYQDVKQRLTQDEDCHIRQDEVQVSLPVRVNLAGGWTDTPPYCNEQGGAVLNAAISLRGELPIHVNARRLDALEIQFESVDIGARGSITSLEELQDCHNPYDPFVLHKAALIACGILPMEGTGTSLEEILKRLGGGIYLSTQVTGVPKGSGLGTSSILAGGCAKALFQLLGKNVPESTLYDIVLCIEQIMSTGGGWQDQVGGLAPGIKCITSRPGIHQELQVRPLNIPAETMAELQERFVLIYTGQRRLARNLLRDVVGNYIGGRPQSVDALYKMKRMVPRMCFELEEGDIDAFARLLDEHWELSKQLDSGSTNTCIDQIFQSCEDLLAAKFICGAGGGGFLQGVLKKGVKKEQLQRRLNGVFEDSGVEVWRVEF